MPTRQTFTTIADVFQAILASVPKVGTWKISPEERTHRLERMHLLLDRCGNPHLAYNVIHVAGTKGKGSTAAFIASALRAAGYQTGLYTSPHVSDPAERMSVTTVPSHATLLSDLMAELQAALAALPQNTLPGAFSWTMFELVTAFAFLYFRAAGCRYAVIETGIGGRWDVTNVVQPIASVLTPLDLEHTDLLGDSLTSIAQEKSGIIKPGCPVFSAHQPPAARVVFEQVSQAQHAPLCFLDDVLDELSAHTSLHGTAVNLRLHRMRPRSFHLNVLGRFQAENAALAYLTLRTVLPRLPIHQILTGFQQMFLPGRMEVVQTTPPVFLDGAHTPLAVERLLTAFQELFLERGILVFGAIDGKNIVDMARLLAPHFTQIIISTPGTFKVSHPEEVTAIFQAVHPHTLLVPDPQDAFRLALHAAQRQLPILVTGSFYLVAEIRKLFL